MKPYRNLLIGSVLILTGVIGLTTTGGSYFSMRNMMGAQLPSGIEAKKLPAPQSNGAKLFTQYCSQCHALPDPTQHTGDEWPAVIQRMVNNMESMGQSVPDEETIETILGFVQKHAR